MTDLALNSNLFLFLLSLVAALLVWALKKLLSIENGMIKLSTWVTGHERLDDARHAALIAQHENLTKMVDKIADKLNRS
jgi:hypothetical protein